MTQPADLHRCAVRAGWLRRYRCPSAGTKFAERTNAQVVTRSVAVQAAEAGFGSSQPGNVPAQSVLFFHLCAR
jgi:hypothetical protein